MLLEAQAPERRATLRAADGIRTRDLNFGKVVRCQTALRRHSAWTLTRRGLMRHGAEYRDQEVPEPERGIEPRTFSLPWRYSATELHGRVRQKAATQRPELNRPPASRPFRWLPCSGNRTRSLLTWSACNRSRWAAGDRTPDLPDQSRTLCLLS